MSGKYVDFEKINGNLKLTLNDEGREYLADDDIGRITRGGAGSTIHDLIEYQLCNGWDRVHPEEIGVLTSCDLIISDDLKRDDQGELVEVGMVYWHPNYQIEDPVDTLRDTGCFVLTGVKGESDPEDESPPACPQCGEELDRDCSGEMRCTTCDGPCPQCDDGGMR